MHKAENIDVLRRRYELCGESMREIGLLLMVFAPLDAAFAPEKLNPVVLVCLGAIEFAGLAIVAAGVYLEAGD